MLKNIFGSTTKYKNFHIIINPPHKPNDDRDQPLRPIQLYCRGKLPKKLDDKNLNKSKKCLVQAKKQSEKK